MAASAWKTLYGLAMAAHGFPVVAVVTLTALVGLTSPDGSADAGRLGLVVFAMFLAQLTIGWSNDYMDRDTDALYQPGKPVPAGMVSARVLLWLAAVAAVGSVCIGFVIELLPGVLLVVGIGVGVAYNLRIKDTSLSWLPYVVGLGVLPLYVWASLDSFPDDWGLLYLVATPLAIAAHLANSIPDIAADRASGRAGLVTRIGLGGAYGLLTAMLVAPPALLGAAAVFVSLDRPSWMLGGLVAYGVMAAGAAICYRISRPDIAFSVVVVAGVVFCTTLLASW